MAQLDALDRVGGMDGADSDPIAALRRQAAAAEREPGQVDEVLCIATT
jgi:predicted short-subunit dehydrogenase-like oxidoreductase (DUF2520 family)